MQRIILSALAAVMSLVVLSQDITDCQAGQLSMLIDDCGITTLQVNGHIDARDFRFIADSLRHLTRLDLSKTIIDGYSGKTLFANVSDYAFGEVPCLSLASMTELQTLVLPDSATRLGDGCLSGCLRLTDVILPTCLEHIGDYAFSGCAALNRLTAPPTLARIGDGAFSNCAALQCVSVIGNGDEAMMPTTLRIGYRSFANCPSLKQISLGNRWVEIGAEALAETGLEQLDLSDQTLLDSLSAWSLSNSQLTQITLPSTLRRIGAGAMMNNEGITQLIIPATVKHINSHAMAYMTGLKQIESKPTEVPELGDSVWYGVDQSQVLLKVSPQSLSDYCNTPQWCNFMTANFPHGDINGDGVVDIADVNIVINIMLGRDSSDNYDGRAYVTDDTVVDIADVNAVINIMLAHQLAMRLAAEKAARQAMERPRVQAHRQSIASNQNIVP